MLTLFKISSSFRRNTYIYIFHRSLWKGSVRKAWVYFQENFPPNSFPLCRWNSPGKNTGMRSHSLFQRIFPTQGSNLICTANSLLSKPTGKPRNTFSSVQSLSHVWPCRPHELQYTRPPCPSPTPGVYSNSCPLTRWCHPAISSSVIPFSSCPQSLPASGFFQWVNSLHEVAKVLELKL